MPSPTHSTAPIRPKCAGTLPASLEVTARSDSGVIMAIRHTQYPVEGVQFHPESILTEHGKELLGNFLRIESRRAVA